MFEDNIEILAESKIDTQLERGRKRNRGRHTLLKRTKLLKKQATPNAMKIFKEESDQFSDILAMTDQGNLQTINHYKLSLNDIITRY